MSFGVLKAPRLATHLPQLEQNDLLAVRPLPVLLSRYVFSNSLESVISTEALSTTILLEAMPQLAFRQFLQWQRLLLRFVRRSFSLSVSLMLPQRHSPVIPSANLAGSWAFGSPPYDGMVRTRNALLRWTDGTRPRLKGVWSSCCVGKGCVRLCKARFTGRRHKTIRAADEA
jgi:hypothetical protein